MKNIALILTMIFLSASASTSSEQSEILVSTGPQTPGFTTISFSSEPGPIVKVSPLYPESALNQRKEGKVALNFIVGVDGEAINIQVINSEGELFNSAAVQALKKCRYHPKYSGKSVAVVAEFTLNKASKKDN